MTKRELKLIAKMTWLGYSRNDAAITVENYKSKNRLKDLERSVKSVYDDKVEYNEVREVLDNVSQLLSTNI